MSLSFLEANRLCSVKNELGTKSFILASSGQTEKLDIFLKSNCILNGFNSQYTTLPFNTLQQYLSTCTECHKEHIFLLFPWDLLPETDWRTGVATNDTNLDEVQIIVNSLIHKINRFKLSHVFYVPAKILPITFNYKLNQQIECQLILSLLKINATILPSDCFSLSSYISNGCAISSKKLSDVTSAMAKSLVTLNFNQKKVLITDFDNVLWNGIIGEDGINKIQCEADGAGYIHYVYQTYLLKLKSQGILIVGVTRNDDELARLPFQKDKTIFQENDFVSISASYYAKSSQIRQILGDLNLDIDSAVFIDDNPIELEEAKNQLKNLCCLQFPAKDEDFPSFIDRLQKYFSLEDITEDDKKRTELYKIRYESSVINKEDGADLTEYLLSLDMHLSIDKCNAKNYQRSLQLINKTNQFNLNGMRLTDSEIIKLMNDKHTLYSFSLSDKFGNHGQIACAILSKSNEIEYFVMSCRVFQRQIEYAIIYWIIETLKISSIGFNFQKTSKNVPFQLMLNNNLFTIDDKNVLQLDTRLYEKEYDGVLKLFVVDVKY